MGKKATSYVGGAAMPMDRYGAQVASQQSLILHNGKVQNTLVFPPRQAITMGPHWRREQTDGDRPATVARWDPAVLLLPCYWRNAQNLLRLQNV
jgi:hypothetical protein